MDRSQIIEGSPPSTYLELLPGNVRRQFDWCARLQPGHIELRGESRYSPGITMFVFVNDFDIGAPVRAEYNDARAVMVAVEDIDE